MLAALPGAALGTAGRHTEKQRETEGGRERENERGRGAQGVTGAGWGREEEAAGRRSSSSHGARQRETEKERDREGERQRHTQKERDRSPLRGRARSPLRHDHSLARQLPYDTAVRSDDGSSLFGDGVAGGIGSATPSNWADHSLSPTTAVSYSGGAGRWAKHGVAGRWSARSPPRTAKQLH